MEQHAQDDVQPEMEELGIAYNVTMRFRRFYKKGERTKELMMQIEMASFRATTLPDKPVIGRLSSDGRGGMVISDEINKEQWHVDPFEIWRAYCEMRDSMLESDK